MSDIVIRVENLGKKYVIGHQQQEKYTALRDVLANKAKGLTQFFNPTSKIQNSQYEEYWALEDVSFEVKRGDRIGIIGRNGAGKSTLLKILSRITEPTTGRISIKGRVASLLEVGTGFHPELTGRENIFLNGAILGMSKQEIRRNFDEIVAFAEVERFLDTPVKRYSSGMYVRLAFAVAAHLEPEILAVDEVLAVGDIAFQKKCLGKMESVTKTEGRTILFVSHNIAAIQALCSKVIYLNKGKLLSFDTTSTCLSKYEETFSQKRNAIWIKTKSRKPSEKLVITKIITELNGAQPQLSLKLYIYLQSFTSHKPAFLAVDILDSSGICIMQAIPKSEGYILPQKDKEQTVRVEISLPPLIPGSYLTSVWIGSHNTETLDLIREATTFEVIESPIADRTFPFTKDHGYVVPNSFFTLS